MNEKNNLADKIYKLTKDFHAENMKREKKSIYHDDIVNLLMIARSLVIKSQKSSRRDTK